MKEKVEAMRAKIDWKQKLLESYMPKYYTENLELLSTIEKIGSEFVLDKKALKVSLNRILN